jgi:hypothetical protein
MLFFSFQLSAFSFQLSAFSFQLIFLFSLFYMTDKGSAQSNFCGVRPNATEQAQYAAIMNQLNGISSSPQHSLTDIPLNASIPIYFWINKVNLINAPSASVLQNAVDRLNTVFHFPNNAHFTLCGQSYINDSRYHTLSLSTTADRDFYGSYRKENVINVYLSETTIGAAGWSFLPTNQTWGYLPAGPLMIVLDQLRDDDFTNQTFAHEIGHLLGLFHTFDEIGGTPELVIRAFDPNKIAPNWNDVTDRMESTPAERLACNTNLIGGTCTPSPCSILDANGDSYVPDATNFMSYHGCASGTFTPEQQRRMTLSLMLPNERANIVNGSCAGNMSNIGILERYRYAQFQTDECYSTGQDGKVIAKNATITIENSSSGTAICTTNSDVQGFYKSCNVPTNSSIKIKPTKNTNYRENISTIDIVLISRHLSGTVPFDHPFQMLAADVDNSGDINGSDMLILRRLILYQISTFPNNVGSWRFVPDFFLNQPSFNSIFKTDPFSATYQGYCYDANSCGNSYMDKITLDMSSAEAKNTKSWSFSPFKVGDVNYCSSDYSIAPNSPYSSSRVANTSYQLRTARPMSMRRSEAKTIVLKSKSAASVVAMQIGLRFLQNKLKINEIEKGDFESANDVFDFNKEDNGELRALWFNKRGKAKNFRVGTVLLKAKVRADTNIDDILAVLNLDAEVLKTEFYDEGGNLVSMDLEWDEDDNNSTNNNAILVNAFPNPFRNEVSLEINSPVAGSATITLSNIITRQSIIITQQLLRGANVVSIGNTASLSPGMLTYSIIVGGKIANGTITKTR